MIAFTILLTAFLAQTPAAGAVRNGVITGQVIDAASGRPISAALVAISGTGIVVRPNIDQIQPALVTGADGRFVFRELTAPGSFTITATKGGYVGGASGRRRPDGPGQPVTISAAQTPGDLIIRMWKTGAISGTVLDEVGEPVIGVRVSVLAKSSQFTTRQFFPIPSAATYTDDRGIYRLSNLPPGDYLVVASLPVVSVKPTVFEDVARTGRGSGELAMAMAGGRVSDLLNAEGALVAASRGSVLPPYPGRGRLHVYPLTMHPSATSAAQASVVTLASGEERTGIDVQLTPVPTVRVSGTIAGSPNASSEIRLELAPPPGGEGAAALPSVASFSDSTGAFVFAGVVPGQYVLRATQPVRGADPGVPQLYWTEMPVTVPATDLDGVTAVLSPPLRISARLQFEGNGEPPSLTSGRLNNTFTLDPVDRPPTLLYRPGTMADGVLTVSGYTPGRYRVRVANSPAGWMFKAAMLNGVDVSETPFDVTRDVTGLTLVFTDRWSGLSGIVSGALSTGSGQAASETATVIAFTTDAQMWQGAGDNPRRLRSTAADATGRFGFGSLPPGSYYVTAIRDEDATDWREPSMLEALARNAVQITIAEGEHKTLTVPLREVRR